ncbi:MAG: hypothetical protein RMK65_10230 [Anaerolineae bacterium]|nr:hypothetical protein [Anaerolineae bacterium]
MPCRSDAPGAGLATAPTSDVGLEVGVARGRCPLARPHRRRPAGHRSTHTLRVPNTGRGASPTLSSHRWADRPTRLSAPYLILPACTSATLTVSVTVPANHGLGRPRRRHPDLPLQPYPRP